MRSTLVATIGKFNPPTIGHERLVSQLRLVAEPFDADIAVIMTRPVKEPGKKKAPLSYEDRYYYACKAFGADVVRDEPVADAFGIMRRYDGQYSRIILVVGEDRLDMIDRIRSYNHKEYHYDEIGYLNVSRRDEVSSSLLRSLVSTGQYVEFRSYLPEALKREAWDIYMKVAKHLNRGVYDIHRTSNIARIA